MTRLRCRVSKCAWTHFRDGLCYEHYYHSRPVAEPDPGLEEVKAQVEECARTAFLACMLWIANEELKRSKLQTPGQGVV